MGWRVFLRWLTFPIFAVTVKEPMIVKMHHITIAWVRIFVPVVEHEKELNLVALTMQRG